MRETFGGGRREEETNDRAKTEEHSWTLAEVRKGGEKKARDTREAAKTRFRRSEVRRSADAWRRSSRSWQGLTQSWLARHSCRFVVSLAANSQRHLRRFSVKFLWNSFGTHLASGVSKSQSAGSLGAFFFFFFFLFSKNRNFETTAMDDPWWFERSFQSRGK